MNRLSTGSGTRRRESGRYFFRPDGPAAPAGRDAEAVEVAAAVEGGPLEGRWRADQGRGERRLWLLRFHTPVGREAAFADCISREVGIPVDLLPERSGSVRCGIMGPARRPVLDAYEFEALRERAAAGASQSAWSR